MKRALIASSMLVSIMILLAYTIFNAKTQNSNLNLLNTNIEKIRLINKDFDLYLQYTLEYNNFDIIEDKINSFSKNLNEILKNKILNEEFSNSLIDLKQVTQIKINKISKVKSHRAVLNNSFRIIQKLKKKIDTNNFDDVYVSILTLDKNPEIDIQLLHQNIEKLQYKNKYEKYFIKHIKTILSYQTKLQDLQVEINQLNLNKKLNKLHYLYETHTTEASEKAIISIGILFTLLILLIITYLIYTFKLISSNSQLLRFRKTVESSDNIVVVTDKNEVIKYVNEAFTKTTGYTSDEVIGKKPSILKSGQQTKEFYKDLHKTIHSGHKWSGEFINIDKFGDLSYEKASITPVLDNGQIKEFIAIKLNITKETVRGQQLKEKENLLVQQSKMASMGEMLENIAHQWRQPLSIISTVATGIVVEKEYGISNKKTEVSKLREINNSVQYLSETINDFRDFFKTDKEKNIFNLSKAYTKTLNIINSKFKTRNIKVIENLTDIQMNGIENEVIQVIINILNNARDVLETKKNQEKLIFVSIYTKDNHAILEIKDNGGGIPQNIINKIFEPYFTTKHQSQGTGIGLYMSYEMVVKHMEGTIKASNVTYDYEDTTYKGACFTLALPL
ncbi:PAS domain-containing sensor histidine kinase [Poseidonibacter lekithochrous]|uniref:PAS domain-containing sensor histidine kinase n=1 Tax=Poseidonibacter lekithochrous TaxID=1904463 RepID=UPI0008FCB33F|nr:PAS domain-containing sensor histidine kinase [Poseidonibacter lekithochrous]QKJ23662.1 PAS sensor-containing two-component system histidine kinase [Poseidonibacter lekithochrous]